MGVVRREMRQRGTGCMQLDQLPNYLLINKSKKNTGRRMYVEERDQETGRRAD